MVTYDPQVLQQLATKLERRAKTIEFSRTVLGIFVGVATASFATKAGGGDEVLGQVVVMGAILGAVLGFASARSAAFALRVQAQTIMCQVVIAHNVGITADHLATLVQLWSPQQHSGQ